MTDRSALNQVRSFQILTSADALLADQTASSFDDLGSSLRKSQLDSFPDEIAEASAASPVSSAHHAIAEALLTTVNFEALNAQENVTAVAHGDTTPLLNDVVHTFDTPTPSSPVQSIVDAALPSSLASPVDSVLAVPPALLGSSIGSIGNGAGLVQAAATSVGYELTNIGENATGLAHGDTTPLLNDVVHTFDMPTPSSPVVSIVDAALPSSLASPVDTVLAVPPALLGSSIGSLGNGAGLVPAAVTSVSYELTNIGENVTGLAHGDTTPLLNDVVHTFDTPTPSSPVVSIVDATLPSALATPVDTVLAVPPALLGSSIGSLGNGAGLVPAAVTSVSYELTNIGENVTGLAHGDTTPLLNDVVHTFDTPTPSSPVQSIVDAALPSSLGSPVDSVLAVPPALLGSSIGSIGNGAGLVQAAATSVGYELTNIGENATGLAHGDTTPLLNDVVHTFDMPTPSSPVVSIVDAALPSSLASPVDTVLAVPPALLGSSIGSLGNGAGLVPAAVTSVSYELTNIGENVTGLAHGDTTPLLNDVVHTFDTPTPSSPVVSIVDATLPSALATPVDTVLAVPPALLGSSIGSLGNGAGLVPAAVTSVSYELTNIGENVTGLAHGDTTPLLNDVVHTFDTPTPSSPVQSIVDAALPSSLASPVDSVLAVPPALLGSSIGSLGNGAGLVPAAVTSVGYELTNIGENVTGLAHGDTTPLLNDVVHTFDTPTPSSPVQSIVDAALPSSLASPVDTVLAVPPALLGSSIGSLGNGAGLVPAAVTSVGYELTNIGENVTGLAHGDTTPLLNDVVHTFDTPTPSSPIQSIVDAALPSALATPVDAVIAAPSALLGSDLASLSNLQADAAPVVAIVDAASLGTLGAGASGNAGALGGDATTAVATLTGSVADAGNALAPVVHDAASTVVADVTSAGNALAGSVAGAANTLGSVAQGEVNGGLSQAAGALNALGAGVTGAANDLAATAHADLGGAVGDVTGSLGSLGGTAVGALNDAASLTQSGLGGVASSVGVAAGSLDSAATGALDGTIAGVQAGVGGVAATAPAAVASLGTSIGGALGETVATVHADLTPVVAEAAATAGTLGGNVAGAISATVSTVQGDLGTVAADVVTAGASLGGTVTGVATVAQAEIGHVAADVTGATALAAATVSGDTSAALDGTTHLAGTVLTETATTVHTGLDTVAAGAGTAVTTAVDGLGTGLGAATSTLHAGLDTATTGAATALTTAGAAVGANLAEATSTVHADIASIADYTGSTATSVVGAVGANLDNVASATHADVGIVTGEVGAVASSVTGGIDAGLGAATSAVHADLGHLAGGVAAAVSTTAGTIDSGLSAGPAAVSTALGSVTGDLGAASGSVTHAVSTGLADVGSAAATGLGSAVGGSAGALATATGALGSGLAETATVAHDAALTVTGTLTSVTSAAPTATGLFTIASGDGSFHFPTTSGGGADALSGIVTSPAAPVTSVVDSASHAVVATVIDHVDVPHVDPLASLAHAVHHA